MSEYTDGVGEDTITHSLRTLREAEQALDSVQWTLQGCNFWADGPSDRTQAVDRAFGTIREALADTTQDWARAELEAQLAEAEDAGHHYVVAVYFVGRAYGGPEEGGWWYTEGVLDSIIGGSDDEEDAYGIAYSFNTGPSARVKGYDGLEAHVVELGRRELRSDVYSCHEDVTADDYVVRWDIPESFPEHRPHYC